MVSERGAPSSRRSHRQARKAGFGEHLGHPGAVERCRCPGQRLGDLGGRVTGSAQLDDARSGGVLRRCPGRSRPRVEEEPRSCRSGSPAPPSAAWPSSSQPGPPPPRRSFPPTDTPAAPRSDDGWRPLGRARTRRNEPPPQLGSISLSGPQHYLTNPPLPSQASSAEWLTGM